jgi:hypothetical protein
LKAVVKLGYGTAGKKVSPLSGARLYSACDEATTPALHSALVVGRVAHINGENVKVVQELTRNANSRCTLNVYTQARIYAKREAQQRIVETILPQDGSNAKIKLQRGGADERLGGSE